VIVDELVGQVKGSGVFSVMLDESTDVSVHQNCVVYVRYLASIGGKVSSLVLDSCPLLMQSPFTQS
jgi:hypothetical protein